MFHIRRKVPVFRDNLLAASSAFWQAHLADDADARRLEREDVYRCHVVLSIPTNPHFGSLNLASALQVIAYDWRQALGGFDVQPAVVPAEVADARQVAGLLAHWEEALVAVGYLDPAAPKKLMPRLNQFFNRAAVTQEEVHILRGVAKAMVQAAERAKD